jgi:hypothetical protein
MSFVGRGATTCSMTIVGILLVISSARTKANENFAQGALSPDFARVNDATSWRLIGADATVEGSVMHLKPHGDPRVGSHIGLALLQNVKFSEGTLEIDLRGAGKQEPSFLGMAFGVADAKTFEAVYFRPFRFADDDPDARRHAVQYVAWPEYTWEKLRNDKRGLYESAISPVPDPAEWFHVRIDVTKERVSVSVDGSTQPCLVVNRLGRRDGEVGLWVDSMPGAFRNLTIRSARNERQRVALEPPLRVAQAGL